MAITDRLEGMSARRETQEAVRRAIEAKPDRSSRIFELLLILCLVIAFGVLIWLLTDILLRSMPVWQQRGIGDFLGRNLSSNPDKAGIAQGLVGSLFLIVVTAIIAIPTGIAAAVYLEEYARDTFVTRTLNTVVRNLAGVPAVVFGILGLAVFVLLLAPITGGRTLLAGGLTLAVVVLPIVIITAAEALRAVPASIREAGYGVGATKWEVTRYHVIPYAAPGILTGIILTLARAFGETAPLLLVGAAAVGFSSPASAGILERLTGPYTALPTIIFSWARQPQAEFKALSAAAIVVLLAVILIINAIAIILRNRYARRW
ncbi:MAG: phosphate ABC transporter permease PstA [Chloroflexota bacterium]